MKPIERKVWLNDGISILAFSFSFQRKLSILFSLFSLTNFYLSDLLGLYSKPNWSFFWITTINLNMPCNPFPSPFLARAPLPTTCFKPEWVISESFGMGTFDHFPTYIALKNSRDLKEHSIAFSSIFTYGAHDEVATIIFSLEATKTSCPSIKNLIFWCRINGTAPTMWIHGLFSKQL